MGEEIYVHFVSLLNFGQKKKKKRQLTEKKWIFVGTVSLKHGYVTY